MLLNDFIDIMNKLAPQETALGFDDQVGLIIGTDRKQIKRVLVALDCTLAGTGTRSGRNRSGSCLNASPSAFFGS